MSVLQQVKDLLQREEAAKKQAPVRVAQRVRDVPEHAGAAAHELTALAGAVCVLELSGLAEREDADRLGDIALSVIEWHISDAGRVLTQGALRYSVHFRDLDAERANIKLEQIGDALRVRLLEATGDAIDVRVSSLAAAPKAADKPGSVNDYVATLFSELEARQLALAQEHEGKLRAVRKDAASLFVPAWNTANEKTDINRCVLDFSLRSAAIKQIRSAIDDAELQAICADYDLMALKKGLLGVYNAKRQRYAPDIMVPVTAFTLTDAQRRAHYIEQIKNAPEAYRQSLIVEIAEPDGQPAPGALADAIAALSAVLKRVVVGVGHDRALLRQALQAQVWGVSVELGSSRKLTREHDFWLKGIGGVCGQAGLVGIAHGVTTIAVANRAMDYGFRYLDGSAVHMAQSQVRPATRLNPFPTRAR
ncbi:hypothetical protein [Pelagibacterium xiamenense]|uniref:hypothetical protein n=1 Tax=Pelagibacterium xiamenense TaxID=2901140 RepID=UPI001E620874|nr:hypothetical protein [Pelagibacterium xiamenense]MCD7059726.1 hypothetical protein [Pelagibacterium xiamenense]